MAQNVLIVSYKTGSEAYQALSELKRAAANDNYVISQAVIVKKENGQLAPQDGFDTGVESSNDTWKGGLIGSLVGILGGPLGVLLGGSMGMVIGGAVDAGDVVKNASLIERVGECIVDGETAIILLADEKFETALTAKLNDFDVSVTRMAAAEVEAEVKHAAEVERQLAKEAREKLRAERTEELKAGMEKKSEEINSNLKDMYNRSSDMKI